MRPQDRPTLGYGMLERAAKEYGAKHGFGGNHGGWIYRLMDTPELGGAGHRSAVGKACAQGWHSFGSIYFRSIADYYTRRLTAFNTFQELLDTNERYCPTILPRTWREQFLANAFDRAMYDRKSPRRAWRGSGVPS